MEYLVLVGKILSILIGVLCVGIILKAILSKNLKYKVRKNYLQFSVFLMIEVGIFWIFILAIKVVFPLLTKILY